MLGFQFGDETTQIFGHAGLILLLQRFSARLTIQ
jgi:hypothetical protein